MDRRRTPDAGNRNIKSPKSRSLSSADYSSNARQSDRLSSDVTPAYRFGLMHNSTVTSATSSQKQLDSTPVAENFNGHDRQMSNVKKLTFDMGELNLMHDKPVESASAPLLESFSSNIRNDFPSLSACLNAKDKRLNVRGSQRKQTGYTVEESVLPHVNASSIVHSSCIGESSKTPDFSIKKDRLLKDKIQRGENSLENAGFNEQSGISHYLYDICPTRTGPTVKLKAPLHVKNKEIRNLNKRRMEKEQNVLILRPGMILLRRYISFNNQVKLIRTCRELGIGPGGFYQPGFGEGAKMNLKMMCLGKNWDPATSAYTDERPSDGARAPLIPDAFSQLVKRAIEDSHAYLKQQRRKKNVEDILPPMSPNICIINFYTKSGRLGLHQDKDETQESLRKGLPVVSFSVGDTAEFVYGDQRDVLGAEKIRLESGDVLIFGGQSRHIYHGVTTIYSDTTPEALMEETNLRPGRLNLTFREY